MYGYQHLCMDIIYVWKSLIFFIIFFATFQKFYFNDLSVVPFLTSVTRYSEGLKEMTTSRHFGSYKVITP